MVRGKSQLILHGSPGRGPRRRLWPASPSRSARRFSSGRPCKGPKCWAAASSLSKPGWGSLGPGGHDCGRPERGDSRPGTGHPSTSNALTPNRAVGQPHRPALYQPQLPSPACPAPLRAASSARAPSRTYEQRRRSTVRRSSGSPSPLAGREVSMGRPLPPPLPPPPPPLGAVSMARRRRRSASSVTQVDPASAAACGGRGGWGSGKGGGDSEPERVRVGASWSEASEAQSCVVGRRWGWVGAGDGNWGLGFVGGLARSDDAKALYLGLRCGGMKIGSGGRWPRSSASRIPSCSGTWESIWLQ